MSKEKVNHQRKWALAVSIWTFCLAICLGLASQILLNRLSSLFLSFLILAAVICLGIVFDLVGTAAAAAKKSPLNAKASRKIAGAKQAVYLVHHAEKVANFCNDVVGDISGIVSGTLAALIILKIASRWPGLAEGSGVYLSIVLTAMVAAFTVGGKALSKTVAINKSTEVILIVGRVISKLEELAGLFSLRRRD
ncbi:MAG TPA: hypothetical protein GX693_02380 [Firmicutes bacterium]|nr:hypothetical protein [Bacillota bacterium]